MIRDDTVNPRLGLSQSTESHQSERVQDALYSTTGMLAAFGIISNQRKSLRGTAGCRLRKEKNQYMIRDAQR